MADINLIGNEQSSSDRNERKSDHYEHGGGYNQGSFNSGSLGSVQETDFDSRDPYMEQAYMKKNSKGIMYVLIGACVVLFGLLLYLVFSPDKDKPAEVVQQPKEVEEPILTPTEVTATVEGPNQEVLNNVESLLNSFPPNLTLSVVRYSQGESQGEFIIESHAKSNEQIDEFNTRIKQALQKGQIKESNKTKSAVTGDPIGITAGFVPQSSIWAKPDQLNRLSYIGEVELKTRIENYSRSNNLQIKEYNIGRTRKENNFQKTMIQLQVVGTRDSATRLLKSLNEDKLNVNFSKIVYSTSERSGRAGNVNLMVHIELFKKAV